MKIYSWNMLFRNPDMDRAFTFVAETDFDVFCLQEVPEEFLARLRELPYQLSVASEVERIFNGIRSKQYVVTLSKHPIVHEGVIPLPYRELLLPLRARIFVGIMTRLKLWALGIGGRHAIYSDVALPNGTVRVFNIHLPLATPAWRAEEFEQTMAKRSQEMPTIVCGDFNILEKPHITPLSWVLGGTLGDMFLYSRERAQMRRRFASHKLINVLERRVTHGISKSQLDHILISEDLEARESRVIEDACGSDHNPIFALVA